MVHQHVLLIIIVQSSDGEDTLTSKVWLVLTYGDLFSVSLESSVPLCHWMNKVKQYRCEAVFYTGFFVNVP